MKKLTRLPWEPVDRYVYGHIGESVQQRRGGLLRFDGRHDHMSNRRGAKDFCRVHGIDRAQIVRWKRDGVTLKIADRLAGLLGLHPFDIWGPDYYAIQGVYDDEVAA